MDITSERPDDVLLNHSVKLRTRTGCVTCRIRRVKCDEAKPACERCRTTGRKCDGYSNLPVPRPSRRTSPSNFDRRCERRFPVQSIGTPILPSFEDDLQRQYFAFFVSCTALVSPIYYGAEFWAHRVLQLSLAEPAIKYALCSLSALHRMFRVLHFKGSDAETMRSYALQQYNKAVSCTHKLIAESIADAKDSDRVIKGLVACVLFVCFENLVGNFQLAQMHLQHGLKILARQNDRRIESREDARLTKIMIPGDIVQVFNRLDLQSMAFADDESPYPFSSSPEEVDLLEVTSRFTSIEDASGHLIHNFRWIFHMSTASEPHPVPLDMLRMGLDVLDRGCIEFERLVKSMEPEILERSQSTVRLLRMYQTIMHIILSTGVYGNELLHDQHQEQYVQVVNFGEALLAVGELARFRSGSIQFFSFETGAIFPLFYTAIKCRDMNTRRRAISLLSVTDHQEGTWTSLGAARVAQFVVDIEEANRSSQVEGEELIEPARVHLVRVATDISQRKIRVKCLLRTTLGEASWYFREGEVSF